MRSTNPLRPSRGFTLIELVIGIVLLAVALGSMMGLLVNQTSQAIDPVQQVRAAQLAQRLFNEILSRSFDAHSDHNGSRWRCGETVDGIPYDACTLPSGYGPDSGENSSYLFDDVDDYHTPVICAQHLTSCSADAWVAASYFTQSSDEARDDYRNFLVRIEVTPGAGCSATGCSTFKIIRLSVRLPDGSELPFVVTRGNF